MKIPICDLPRPSYLLTLMSPAANIRLIRIIKGFLRA
jgi:hypothetical protein